MPIKKVAGGRMTRIVRIEKCWDCPMFDMVNVGEHAVHLSCHHMKIAEIVRGGLAQKEIDIMNEWFYNICDLTVVEDDKPFGL